MNSGRIAPLSHTWPAVVRKRVPALQPRQPAPAERSTTRPRPARPAAQYPGPTSGGRGPAPSTAAPRAGSPARRRPTSRERAAAGPAQGVPRRRPGACARRGRGSSPGGVRNRSISCPRTSSSICLMPIHRHRRHLDLTARTTSANSAQPSEATATPCAGPPWRRRNARTRTSGDPRPRGRGRSRRPPGVRGQVGPCVRLSVQPRGASRAAPFAAAWDGAAGRNSGLDLRPPPPRAAADLERGDDPPGAHEPPEGPRGDVEHPRDLLGGDQQWRHRGQHRPTAPFVRFHRPPPTSGPEKSAAPPIRGFSSPPAWRDSSGSVQSRAEEGRTPEDRVSRSEEGDRRREVRWAIVGTTRRSKSLLARPGANPGLPGLVPVLREPALELGPEACPQVGGVALAPAGRAPAAPYPAASVIGVAEPGPLSRREPAGMGHDRGLRGVRGGVKLPEPFEDPGLPPQADGVFRQRRVAEVPARIGRNRLGRQDLSEGRGQMTEGLVVLVVGPAIQAFLVLERSLDALRCDPLGRRVPPVRRVVIERAGGRRF